MMISTQTNSYIASYKDQESLLSLYKYSFTQIPFTLIYLVI